MIVNLIFIKLFLIFWLIQLGVSFWIESALFQLFLYLLTVKLIYSRQVLMLMIKVLLKL
jgi:hypothetical protein